MMTFEQELQISYVANDTAIKPDKVLWREASERLER
jgi:hypothetical protein